MTIDVAFNGDDLAAVQRGSKDVEVYATKDGRVGVIDGIFVFLCDFVLEKGVL
jgi:hypothetical protein